MRGSARKVIALTANGGNSRRRKRRLHDAVRGQQRQDMASLLQPRPCSEGRKNRTWLRRAPHPRAAWPQTSTKHEWQRRGDFLFQRRRVCGMTRRRHGGSTKIFPWARQFFTTSSGTSHRRGMRERAALLPAKLYQRGLERPSAAMTKGFLMNYAPRYMKRVRTRSAPLEKPRMGEVNLGVAFDGVPGEFSATRRPSIKFTASGQTRTFKRPPHRQHEPFRVTIAWTTRRAARRGNAT